MNSPQYEIDKPITKQRESEEQAKTMTKQKELEEQVKTRSLLQEFKNLNLNSVPNVVNWIGKMSTCKNDVIANKNEILPLLKASGYKKLSELAETNSNKDANMTAERYIKFNKNLDEVGIYIVCRAISDIEDLGAISGIMNHFVQIYEQRLSEQDKIDNDFSIRRR